MAFAFMTDSSFNSALLDFIHRSPTPFHAVECQSAMLSQAGFQLLDEADSWNLDNGGGYFVRRGGSIIAFRLGRKGCQQHGIHVAGAHTDSPCLKIKPQALVEKSDYWQLCAEVYGGALLNPWFDRDLSIAGKVIYRASDNSLRSCLINFEDPVAVIPSLAIHLDREANTNRSVNAQEHLRAVLSLRQKDTQVNFHDLLLDRLRTRHQITDAETILSYDLCLYDTQPPALTGLDKEFIAGARLDNLLSCYLITRSLIESNGNDTSLIVCNDHEEVGSVSASGAQGPFLLSVLSRLVASESTAADAMERMLRRSMMLSIDNAHGVHPNFADKHDSQHGPILNGGPVIKVNANQRYASDSETMANFRAYCEAEGVPCQSFVMRNDMGCGSTIGPITAAETGLATVDVGVPTFAMHSIRELAGSQDAANLAKVVTAFFNRRIQA